MSKEIVETLEREIIWISCHKLTDIGIKAIGEGIRTLSSLEKFNLEIYRYLNYVEILLIEKGFGKLQKQECGVYKKV